MKVQKSYQSNERCKMGGGKNEKKRRKGEEGGREGGREVG
jgi:hypothetical protein